MMRTRISFLILMLVVLPADLATAQVATGTPPYSTINGGPDQINLSNLNVHLTIPVLHKKGRGLPFNFDLGYDSTFWEPVPYNGTTYWDPITTAGWDGSAIDIGYLGYVVGTDGVEFDYICDFVYYDGFGTAHWFGAGNGYYPGCAVYDFYYGIDYPLTTITTDNSGYTLTADAYTGIATLTSADGNHIIPLGTLPLDPQVKPGSVIDRNGNEITESTTGQFTDTLGTIALTQSGGTSNPLDPEPSYFTYTGPNSTEEQVVVTPIEYTVQTNFGCSGIVEYSAQGGALVDHVTLPDSSEYKFTYELTPGSTTNTTGRIASVTLPTGGTISYAYTGGSHGIECTDGSTAGLQRTTPDSTTPWTYTRTIGSGAATKTTVVDPLGNNTVVQFQGIYETQRQVYTGAISSASLLETTNTCYNGSASPCTGTAITLPISKRTVISQLGAVGTGLESEKVYSYNTYGLPTEEDDYDFGTTGTAPGGLLRKVITAYDTALTNGILDKVSSITIENGSSALVAQTSFGYDATTPTATSGTPQHVAVSGSRGNMTSLTEYVNSTTNLYQTLTYYDTGNISTTTDVSTSSTTHGASTTYNYASGSSCGNSFVTSVSEPLSLSKSMTWDCTGGVKTTATDENSQVITYSYENSGGTADPFWRPLQVTNPYQGSTSTGTYGYTPNLTEMDFPYNSHDNGVDALGRPNLNAQSYSSYNTGCGYTCVGTDWFASGVLYDGAGRPAVQQIPYVESVPGPRCAAGRCTVYTPFVNTTDTTGTSTTYDGLSRVIQSADSGGGYTSYNYAPNGTYNYNVTLTTLGPLPANGVEKLKQKQLQDDGLGRTTSVCEITSAAGSGSCKQSVAQTGFWTTYTYDALGDITAVSQNAQSSSPQSRTFTYDGLGRLLSESNPESGKTTYVYDTDTTCGTFAGSLVRTTDAVGNVICFGWDVLHRETSVTYNSGSYKATTPTKCFVYDSATVDGSAMPYPKTRIAEAYTTTSSTCPSSTKTTDLGFGYSQRGEVTDVYESTPHSGGYYHTTAAYWQNGIIESLTGVPGESSFAFGLTWTQKGLPESSISGTLETVTQGSAGNSVVSYVGYDAANQVNAVTYGSGDNDAYTYDPNTDRMTQYQFNVGSTVQTVAGTLTWNANGTLSSLGIVDPFNSADAQTCNFFHDDLARLAGKDSAGNTVDCGSTWKQAFTLDAYGNISKTGSSSFAASYNSNNRISSVGTCTPVYDLNGNLQSDCSYNYTYTWDADGNLATVNNGTATTLVYDAFDRMVEKQSGTTYTEVLYSPIGKQAIMDGQTRLTDYLPLPGGGFAVYDSVLGNYYRHADHLGSARFASTTSRTMLYDRAFAPYGESYASAGSTSDLTFTGQNQTTVSGLYDFLYRRYHPVQGRWISPDPAGMSAVNPANPQSWNRYAYVSNNPLAIVDPQGLDGCDDFGDCGGDGGGDPCDWGGCDGGGWGGGGWGGPPIVVQGGPVYGGNGIFSGQDCLSCFPLGPSPMQILQAVLSGNIWGALQGLGAIPQDDGCDFGPCDTNSYPGAMGLTNNNMPGCNDKNSSLLDKGIQYFSVLRIGEHPVETVVGAGAKYGFIRLLKWGASDAQLARLGIWEAATAGLGTLVVLGSTALDATCFMPITPPTPTGPDGPSGPIWQQ